ncbi:GMC oxidoreductase [Nocardia arthritidis]|uniref:Cholesterol oxidase n=1 Tax=Nocardia arthritidis TaxID=228602 RepID=A0A6G9YLG1_9NOCA|nr:GMC oxidoreductase [Nocardia arthritidis]QIS14021.1 NAD(P)-binding protein [Nocardia arthritidis]
MDRSLLTRRALLRGATTFGAAAGAAMLARTRARADNPSHRTAIVIGSGFGGAIAAYRLAAAGVDVLTLERGRAYCQSDEAMVFDSALDYRDPRWLWDPNPAKVTGLGEPYVAESVGIGVAACVGGGSTLYAGATVPPARRYFDKVFPTGLGYDELASVYWPRVVERLGARPVPDDVRAGAAFAHVRLADEQLAAAGMPTEPVLSTYNWDKFRAVVDRTGGAPTESGPSCSWQRDGVKNSVTGNYLRWAAQSPKWNLLELRDVRHIAYENGKFTVDVAVLDGADRSETYTCDHLFLGAGTLGTARLLLRSRKRGGLPDLNEHVGTLVGDNGDQVTCRTVDAKLPGRPASAIITSAFVDDDPNYLPVRVETMSIPGPVGAAPLLAQLTTTADWEHRTSWTWRGDEPMLTLPADSWRDSLRAANRIHERIIERHGGSSKLLSPNGFPFVPGLSFTVHPLGGVPIGAATDLDGRVIGYRNLYVVDGSLIPGNCAGANPSLTIAGLAERVMDRVLGDIAK